MPEGLLIGLTLACVILALVFRRQPVALALAAVAAVVIALRADMPAWGPSAITLPDLDAGTLITAFVVLVIPQVPLTFANSCLATADAARTYFGDAARRVRPGRLAVSLGVANLLAGSLSGMPVCHGAGGLTAHQAFGARSWRAPVLIGTTLMVLALGVGAGLAALLGAFPIPILAGLLGVAGLLHIALLRDLAKPAHWAIAIGVGALGFLSNLSIALAAGLVLWWVAVWILRSRPDSTASQITIGK
jgi:hypothetical protein